MKVGGIFIDELAKLYKDAIDKHSFEKEYSEASRFTKFKVAKDLIKKGKDEEAKEVIRNAIFNENYPKRKRIIINDTSVEKPYDRVSRGHVHIENLTLSLLGGIQPSRIKPVIKDAISGSGNDGLIQRLQLAIWPLDNKNWRWIDKSPNLEAYNQYKIIFQKFFNLSSQKQLRFRFSEAAQKIYTEWMVNNHKNASCDIHPALESHYKHFSMCKN